MVEEEIEGVVYEVPVPKEEPPEVPAYQLMVEPEIGQKSFTLKLTGPVSQFEPLIAVNPIVLIVRFNISV